MAFEAPRNVKELQRYLGVCNYDRVFVEHFSTLAAPLFELLRSSSRWDWTEHHQKAFDNIREQLAAEVSLRHPDLDKPFVL